MISASRTAAHDFNLSRDASYLEQSLPVHHCNIWLAFAKHVENAYILWGSIPYGRSYRTVVIFPKVFLPSPRMEQHNHVLALSDDKTLS